MPSEISKMRRMFPERFAFRQAANVAQAFGHHAQAWAKSWRLQLNLCFPFFAWPDGRKTR
jgi:hypothetical protein